LYPAFARFFRGPSGGIAASCSAHPSGGPTLLLLRAWQINPCAGSAGATSFESFHQFCAPRPRRFGSGTPPGFHVLVVRAPPFCRAPPGTAFSFNRSVLARCSCREECEPAPPPGPFNRPVKLPHFPGAPPEVGRPFFPNRPTGTLVTNRFPPGRSKKFRAGRTTTRTYNRRRRAHPFQPFTFLAGDAHAVRPLPRPAGMRTSSFSPSGRTRPFALHNPWQQCGGGGGGSFPAARKRLASATLSASSPPAFLRNLTRASAGSGQACRRGHGPPRAMAHFRSSSRVICSFFPPRPANGVPNNNFDLVFQGRRRVLAPAHRSPARVRRKKPG